jgi:hypothetical protein
MFLLVDTRYPTPAPSLQEINLLTLRDMLIHLLLLLILLQMFILLVYHCHLLRILHFLLPILFIHHNLNRQDQSLILRQILLLILNSWYRMRFLPRSTLISYTSSSSLPTESNIRQFLSITEEIMKGRSSF